MVNNKEKREAIDAGLKALDCLYSAKEKLQKAQGWGVFDMLGGGIFASLIKRNKIKNAQDDIDRAQAAIESFSKELSDVVGIGDINYLDMNDFYGISDLIFDNIFSDLAVQQRIKDNIQQIDLAIQKIEYLLDGLTK